MSKLGKKPILIPKDTTVKIESGKLILAGPKGSRELNINDKMIFPMILELTKRALKNAIFYHTLSSIYIHNKIILSIKMQ